MASSPMIHVSSEVRTPLADFGIGPKFARIWPDSRRDRPNSTRRLKVWHSAPSGSWPFRRLGREATRCGGAAMLDSAGALDWFARDCLLAQPCAGEARGGPEPVRFGVAGVVGGALPRPGAPLVGGRQALSAGGGRLQVGVVGRLEAHRRRSEVGRLPPGVRAPAWRVHGVLRLHDSGRAFCARCARSAATLECYSCEVVGRWPALGWSRRSGRGAAGFGRWPRLVCAGCWRSLVLRRCRPGAALRLPLAT